VPYKERWKRTEAVRRFRRRQRERQLRSREPGNARPTLPIGTPAQASAPVQTRTPAEWFVWGISAFAVLLALAGRKSAPVYEGPPWPFG
jgi:hypothetical protein